MLRWQLQGERSLINSPGTTQKQHLCISHHCTWGKKPCQLGTYLTSLLPKSWVRIAMDFVPPFTQQWQQILTFSWFGILCREIQLLYLTYVHLAPITAKSNQPTNHPKEIFAKQILKKIKGSADKINICEMDKKDNNIGNLLNIYIPAK